MFGLRSSRLLVRIVQYRQLIDIRKVLGISHVAVWHLCECAILVIRKDSLQWSGTIG